MRYDVFSYSLAVSLTTNDQRHPVAGTGKRTNYGPWRDAAGRSSGVSSNSHVLQHQYMSEGKKGKHLRRKVRRMERGMWRAEVAEELSAILYDDDAYEDCF